MKRRRGARNNPIRSIASNKKKGKKTRMRSTMMMMQRMFRGGKVKRADKQQTGRRRGWPWRRTEQERTREQATNGSPEERKPGRENRKREENENDKEREKAGCG